MASSTRRKESRRRPGRPPKLSPEQKKELVALVRDNPLLSLDDTVQLLRQEIGVTLSTVTIRKYLKEAGFKRRRPSRAEVARAVACDVRESDAAESQRKGYGYNESHRDPGDQQRYPCGLTDREWEEVQGIFDPPDRTGRPEKYPRRQVLDACVYVLRSGCSWRMLPKDFPPWMLVYKTFRRWVARGLFEQMYDALRKLWRAREQRAVEPSAAVLDSQSVKTSPQGGPKGYDAGKKVKGRKRHLVTDTLGLLLAVLITPANIQDRDAAMPSMDLAKEKVPSLQMLYVDGGYAGRCAQAIRDAHAMEVEVVRHPRNRNVGRWCPGQLPLFDLAKGFAVLPKRWVVERTNAWNDRPRRMAKDHDRNLDVSAAWIWLTEARMLLRRLTA